MKKHVIEVIVMLLAVAASALAFMAASQQANAGPYDNDPYLPVNIQVGPGSHDTFFTITDNSRSRTVRYVCGFTSPKLTGINSDGTRVYVPQVQCNVG